MDESDILLQCDSVFQSLILRKSMMPVCGHWVLSLDHGRSNQIKPSEIYILIISHTTCQVTGCQAAENVTVNIVSIW